MVVGTEEEGEGCGGREHGVKISGEAGRAASRRTSHVSCVDGRVREGLLERRGPICVRFSDVKM